MKPGVALLVVAVALAAAPLAVAYDVVPVPDGGTLTGVVRFTGRPPAPVPLAVHRGRNVCGDAAPREPLALGPDLGVQGSVVIVENVARGKRPGGEKILDTRHCAFVPHVITTMVGEKFLARNSDSVVHNPQGLGPGPIFNVALPSPGQVVDLTRRFAKPGVVRAVCGLHPAMSAWIVVTDSPYAAVTDERGTFRIDGIPPGRYTVVMWHEGFRARGVDKDGRPRYERPHTLEKHVTIEPRASTSVAFALR